MKSLDKKKPKELDWEKTFYDNFCSRERNPYSNETFYIVDGNERNPEKYLKFIQSLLTQQRTELLEEINKLPDLTTTEFGEETISRLEVINLVKK